MALRRLYAKDEGSAICRRHRAEDARSGEVEEGRRGWKKCSCFIHVSGTLGGKFSGKSDWDEAKAMVSVWETARSWEGPVKSRNPQPRPRLPSTAVSQLTAR